MSFFALHRWFCIIVFACLSCTIAFNPVRAAGLPSGTTFPLVYASSNGTIFMVIMGDDKDSPVTGNYAGDAKGMYRLYNLGETYTQMTGKILNLDLTFGDYSLAAMKGKAKQDTSGKIEVTCGRGPGEVPTYFTPVADTEAGVFETSLLNGTIPVYALPDVRRPVALYKKHDSEVYFYVDAAFLGTKTDERLYIGPPGQLVPVALAKVEPRDCDTCAQDIHTKAGGSLIDGKWQPDAVTPPETLDPVSYYISPPKGHLSGELDAQKREIDYGPIMNAQKYYGNRGEMVPLDASVLSKIGIDTNAYTMPTMHTLCTP